MNVFKRANVWYLASLSYWCMLHVDPASLSVDARCHYLCYAYGSYLHLRILHLAKLYHAQKQSNFQTKSWCGFLVTSALFTQGMCTWKLQYNEVLYNECASCLPSSATRLVEIMACICLLVTFGTITSVDHFTTNEVARWSIICTSRHCPDAGLGQ